MITIWKLENESWSLVEEFSSMEGLPERLQELRQDGSEYRAELRSGGFAQILEA